MELRNLATGGVFGCSDEMGNRLLAEGGYEKFGGRQNVEIEDPEEMTAAFDPQVEPPVKAVPRKAPVRRAPAKKAAPRRTHKAETE